MELHEKATSGEVTIAFDDDLNKYLKEIVESALQWFEFYNYQLADADDISKPNDNEEEKINTKDDEEREEDSNNDESDYSVSDEDIKILKRWIKYKTCLFEREVKKLKQKWSYYNVLNDSTEKNPKKATILQNQRWRGMCKKQNV